MSIAFSDFSAVASVAYDEAASTALGKGYWRVAVPFTFTLQTASGPRTVTIPQGYLTDGASVPRPFWWLLPPWGSYGQAAIVHDYLCERLYVTQNNETVTITRAEADAAFKKGMIDLKVPRWKRDLMYVMVRCYAKLARVHGPDYDPAKAAYYTAHPQMEPV